VKVATASSRSELQAPVHEVQNDFRYDLRIKAVLDDGVKAA
jgi:hypothetical protein